MRVLDLFPTCTDARCPQVGRHKHPLPSQLTLIHSDAKFICSLGGYGSGKTYAACVLCVLLMMAAPGNKGFIGRMSYPELHDSTLRVFLEVLQRTGIEDIEFKENWGGFPHRIILPNGSEAIFRELKNVGRFLGPEYGFFYLDEAAQAAENAFTGLLGRLRLPRAGQHLKGILTTNPPHKNHWIAKRWGLEAGKTQIGDSSYHLLKTSTRDNPHLPPGYLKDLLTNLDPNEISRVVEGNFGFVTDGPAVYPEFKHTTHVGVPDTLPVALMRGWDFGFRHPACSWSQFFRCRRNKLHWNILHELDAKELEAEQFARLVLAETRSAFPTHPASMVLEVGDAAGAAVSDRGPGPIITLGRPPFNLRFRYRKVVDIDPGLELVRRLLRTRCECGQPAVVVHRRCRNLIDAMAGGYHYPRVPKPKDKPIKDGFYDDFADTLRYKADAILRVELLDPNWLDLLNERPQAWATGRPGWAWMQHEPTPEQMAEEIARITGRPYSGRPH